MRGGKVSGSETESQASLAEVPDQAKEPVRRRAKLALRWALFVYLGLALSPIRCEIPLALNLDNTWMFAVNYAAAHHLTMGRDYAWTFGPLCYLLTPFDVGNNLAKGLIFQAVLWILLVAILWDLFFGGDFRVRNLAVFSALVGLSSFSVHQQRYPGAPLLYAGLILLAHFRLRGGMIRYVGALVILGLTPLMQFYQALIAAGIVVGLGADLILRRSPTLKRELAIAAAVPLAVAVVTCAVVLGSFGAAAGYIKWSLELVRGYGAAMSIAKAQMQFLAGLGLIALLGIVLLLMGRRNREGARFFALTLVIPLILSLKHGFVRQDGTHVAQFACFVALALGVISLELRLDERLTKIGVAVVLVLFALLWANCVPQGFVYSVEASLSGIRSPVVAWDALHFGRLRGALDAEARQQFPPGAGIEPEIRSVVGHEPTAFYAEDYSNVAIDDINLALFPVLQPSTAYTPSLDEWNAFWLDGNGPRFLIIDGLTVDGRQPWIQTPRAWAEVYRWYNTRWLGPNYLLLERRVEPRFSRFAPIAHGTVRFGQELQMPASAEPVFWSLQCRMTFAGRLRELLLRVPPVVVGMKEGNGSIWWDRAVVPALKGPSLGNELPTSLAEFGEVFTDGHRPDFSVVSLEFLSLGKPVYAPECEVEFLRAVR